MFCFHFAPPENQEEVEAAEGVVVGDNGAVQMSNQSIVREGVGATEGRCANSMCPLGDNCCC